MIKAMANTAGGSRVQSVDLLRGLVMLLLALDILRYYISGANVEPTDLERTNAALFFTRWITHYFAPVYLLLAGVGAYLKGQGGITKKQLSLFLLVRGAILITVEIFVVGFLWSFDFNIFPILFQFIWVLGASMIILAGLIWLPLGAIAGISLLVLFGHNLLDGFSFGPGYWANVLDGLFHKEAVVCADICRRAPGEVYYAFISYPLIPWFAVMSLGYALGALFGFEPARRKKILLFGGIAATVLFLAVRGLNGYGSPAPWATQDNPLWTLMSFLNVKKYPPSLAYLLMTLGPALILLAWFDQIRGWAAKAVRVYGRAPIFFYLVQFLLAHVLALILGVGQGFSVDQLMRPFWQFPDAYGVSLLWVYVAWLAELALMYPLCEWFGDLKNRNQNKLLSYF